MKNEGKMDEKSLKIEMKMQRYQEDGGSKGFITKTKVMIGGTKTPTGITRNPGEWSAWSL